MTVYAITTAASAGLIFSIVAGTAQENMIFNLAAVDLQHGTSYISSVYSAEINTLRKVVAIYDVSQSMINRTERNPAIAYPPIVEKLSAVVVTASIVSLFVGYFWPGPLTGIGLPICATLWWGLYRVIKRYDRQIEAS